MIHILALACLLGAAPSTYARATTNPVVVRAQEPSSNRLQLVPIVSDERLEYVEESVDGTRLITHDRGFAPKLWDPRTMRILRILGQGESIQYVTFSKNGEWILTQSATSVAIWDSAKGRRVATVQPILDNDTFTVSAISKDGKSCAVGTKKGWTAIFPIAKPDDPEWRSAHASAVECLDWSPDSSKIATGATDGTAGTWDAKTQEFVQRFDGASQAVQWIEWSVDGEQVLATSRDNHARLYKASDGKLLLEQEHVIGEKGFMNNTLMAALFVGKNGDGLLTADRWGVMHIIDRKTLKPLRTLPLYPPEHQTDSGGSPVGAIREIRKSRDGRRIGTYSTDEKLGLWDADTGKEFPFDRQGDNPTAGEFSPNGEVFWVGYDDGTIRRHELETGHILSKTFGSIRPFVIGLPVGAGSGGLWTEFRTGSLIKFVNERVLWPVDSLAGNQSLKDVYETPEFSADGKHMLIWDSAHDNVGLYELPSGRGVASIKSVEGAVFSPDGSKIVTWEDGKRIIVWNTKLEPEKMVPLTPEAHIFHIAPTPEAKTVVLVLKDGTVGELNLEKEGESQDFGKVNGEYHQAVVSPDGRWVAVAGDGELEVWNLYDRSHHSLKGVGADPAIGRPGFSQDSSVVVLDNQDSVGTWDVKTGEPLVTFQETRNYSNADPALLLSPTKPWFLHWTGSKVDIWNYSTKAKAVTLELSDQVSNAAFARNGTRLLTTDPTDGVVIWDVTTATPKKLGAFMVMQNADWLVMDTEGRFDAADPSHVDGASYVLEWEKGLEPIAVSQLKSQFYEPGLLAKLMGADPEPRRSVPDLSALRLYPDMKLVQSKDASTKVNITLQDRDGGGIGKTIVLLNGKQVLKKDGDGYIQFDASEYSQFLLPEPELQGHGNILSVQVANEDGTLTSMPQVIDVGIPLGLKTPEVSLYALCVGVGNYAGTKGDLKAPPRDATDLAKALDRVGNRLLPGRVHVDTLSTGEGDSSLQPTRTNILQWLSATAAKATSSDILFVFLAGHGTSSIGTARDYFYLTAEADPGDVNQATASTGAISGDELRAALAKIACNKQVVVLDTCHSGAAAADLIASRSVSGDYQRAWEQIKDTTGTWLLAATASDTLSYESSNVDHGVLTYSLLEAIDKATPEGLKPGSNGDLFVDVEQWLNYAVSRVDSLKNEVGVIGVQRPELRRSLSNDSFSIGVERPEDRGAVGLKPPMPIVIVGPFEQDQEDPLGLETKISDALRNATRIKPWFDIAKHPNVYRVAGTYTVAGDKVTIKVVIQKFDQEQNRKTVQSFEVNGSAKDLDALSVSIRQELETKIAELETAKVQPK